MYVLLLSLFIAFIAKVSYIRTLPFVISSIATLNSIHLFMLTFSLVDRMTRYTTPY